MNLHFTYESRNTRKSFSFFFLAVKTIPKLNMEHSIKLEIEIQNVSRRRSHSTDKANFGHFTLLLLLRTQRSLQRFLRTCTVIVLLMKRFVVAVVVFFNSLMSPNYRFSRKCSDTLLIPTPEFLVLSDGELTTTSSF